MKCTRCEGTAVTMEQDPAGIPYYVCPYCQNTMSYIQMASQGTQAAEKKALKILDMKLYD